MSTDIHSARSFKKLGCLVQPWRPRAYCRLHCCSAPMSTVASACSSLSCRARPLPFRMRCRRNACIHINIYPLLRLAAKDTLPLLLCSHRRLRCFIDAALLLRTHYRVDINNRPSAVLLRMRRCCSACSDTHVCLSDVVTLALLRFSFHLLSCRPECAVVANPHCCPRSFAHHYLAAQDMLPVYARINACLFTLILLLRASRFCCAHPPALA